MWEYALHYMIQRNHSLSVDTFGCRHYWDQTGTKLKHSDYLTHQVFHKSLVIKLGLYLDLDEVVLINKVSTLRVSTACRSISHWVEVRSILGYSER